MKRKQTIVVAIAAIAAVGVVAMVLATRALQVPPDARWELVYRVGAAGESCLVLDARCEDDELVRRIAAALTPIFEQQTTARGLTSVGEWRLVQTRSSRKQLPARHGVRGESVFEETITLCDSKYYISVTRPDAYIAPTQPANWNSHFTDRGDANGRAATVALQMVKMLRHIEPALKAVNEARLAWEP